MSSETGNAARQGEAYVFPVSLAQRRLWLLEQLQRTDAGTASPIFNMPWQAAIRGELDVPALRRALAAVVARHEALRTTFAVRDGEPVQLVWPEIEVALPVVDLAALPGAADRLAREEARRGFRLARGPLIRILLLRLGDAEHRLLLTLHHLIADGWSVGVLAREIEILYTAIRSGRPSPLPDLELQYADYAEWQREELSEARLEELLAYWRERLRGAPTMLGLATDRPRRAQPDWRAGQTPVAIPAEVLEGVDALGGELGATRFVTLLTAFQTLLHRITGQSDLLVGTVTAGRRHEELEPLVGFFVNTLVMRSRFAAGVSFREAVRQTRLGAREDFLREDLPFDRLVRALEPRRGRGATPLFQVLFVLQEPLPDGPAGFHWQARTLPAVQFDLTLDLTPASRGVVEYRAELFDATTVARLAAAFARLLGDAVERPATSLGRLSLLSPAECHALLVDWSRGDDPHPGASFVSRVFAAQVARRPDAVAVDAPGLRLTYRELAARAARLAARLGSLGVGPERVVGLFLDRSPEAVIGILAVLGGGAAYLPLDPGYPAERLAFMLEDAGATLLVTRRSLAAKLPRHRATVVEVGVDEPAPALPSRTASPASGQLAYVIYTSGSTGHPKGVMVSHRGLVSMAAALCRRYRITAGSRLLQFAALSFDAAVAEIVPTLLAGGTLCFAEDDALLPGPALAKLIRERRVTNLTLVPSALAALPDDDLPSLRSLSVAGEACPAELAARWAPGRHFVNAYGPTEATVCASAAAIDPRRRDSERPPPIGRPVAASRLFVVDGRLVPAPIGVPGQLLIGGDGLARGYLGRPGRTAERFVPDALSGERGRRLYASGDRVRFLAGGELEFLGRVDEQIKLRGFRIEPGEIEALLTRQEGIREAVAVVRDDVGATAALVAYVTAAPGSSVAGEALRRTLGAHLPGFMVPSAVMVLESFPHLPNGKVDRGALPRPDRPAASPATPLAPEEELVAGVWAEVLGLEEGRVAAGDDFLELGGHSLLATQVVARLSRTLDLELDAGVLFAAPTVRQLAAEITRLRDTAPRAVRPPIVPRPRGPEALPLLSFAQQRLWFLDRLEPGRPVYNIPAAFEVEGPLAAAALAAALGAVVARHEVLRTSFPEHGDGPVQLVAPPSPPPLPLVDLAALPAAARQAAAGRLAAAEARRPFDLARGPLLRATLLRFGVGRHRLLLTLHHIVADGWSMPILTAELDALYHAARGRQPPPPPPVQYADFALWQRSWLTDETLAPLLALERERLAGAPPVLELPADRPRPPVPTYRGALAAFPLGATARAALSHLCRAEGATLFMGLLAAFAAWLGRASGQRDLLVGTPAANRNQVEIEGLIGFFVNTLVLRCDLTAPTFRELLVRLRGDTLAAFAHRELPFEKLVEALAPQRDLSRGPLFQVMFVLQNVARRSRDAGREVSFELGEVDSGTAKFDLTLFVEDAGGELSGVFEFSTDLFDDATVRRFAGHFRTLLAAAAGDPDRAVAGLPLLTAAERQQLVKEWNDTSRDVPGVCLHELFEAQARRTPDAVALVAEGERLSYRELDVRAARLAGRLVALGVGPEVLVGVFARRSSTLVAGLLAILKAGGAYVPLDPAYPEERLSFILEDAAITVLLTTAGLAERLPEHPARVVDLEAAASAAGGVPTRQAAVGGNLAYLIYTSGSTGRPKAVAIAHRSAVALACWAREAFDGHELAGVLAATSITFDLSVFEIFVPLAWGGRVVLARDALHLASLPAASEVTLVNTVPSAIAELVRLDALPARTAFVNLAGEPLTRALVDEIYRRPAVRRVRNLYGPSEDTTYTTWCTVGSGERREPPIGRPVHGTRIHVVDHRGGPVPCGVPGELLTGGEGLARGYLGRPALTAGRFVPDPFAERPGERLYRTGDLARTRADGALEFLGRFDHQVKIRGYRIELGEIEAAVLRLSGVREAVVAARGSELVAYVVAAGNAAAGWAGELSAALARELPAYMVPAAFVRLAALPRTPNGKVDRAALPAPEPRSGPERPYVPPRGPLEDALARIWAEVLELAPAAELGVLDDFFQLGGHSLRATRVVSRVRSVFGVELPVRALFETPTLAGLGERLAAVLGGGESPAPLPLRRLSRGSGGVQTFPLSFAQQRLWLLERYEPGLALYNLPALYHLRGPVVPAAVAGALRAVVTRHEALRTTFIDGPMQRVHRRCELAMPRVDLEALPAERRHQAAERLAAMDARQPFDLERGPLLRALLLRLAADDHRLLVVMHHIVADGWSLDVLRRELSAFYDAAVAGRPAELPALPVQYADFAVWQRRWLEGGCGEVLQAQLAYWRRQLAGAPAPLELPADRPRPTLRTHRGASLSRRWPGELARRLEAVGGSRGATLFMTLLAAFAALLHRYAGEDDLAIGTPVANRTRTEIEGLIGFFVNTLVMRCRCAGDPRFDDLLRQVRETALGAYAHQDLPFERLVEELVPQRDLVHTPLFQVVFLFERAAGEESGLVGAAGTVDTGTAKFDLTLHLLDAGPELVASVEYNADLFDPTTLARLLGHLHLLLAGIASQPSARLGELPILGPAPRHEILREWRERPGGRLRGDDLAELFADRAARHRDDPALVFAGGRWTYGELDARANRLAHRLRRLGVDRETPVAIVLERSPELVAAILGVLKAGGVYVPLAVDDPRERLAVLMADLGIRVAVTHGALEERLPEVAHVVRLDRDEAAVAPPPPRRPHPEHLAYVLYTSGSTGVPKGVAVPHRAVVRLVCANDFMRLGAGETFLMAAPANFDASTLEIWGPLLHGGRLVLLPPGPVSLEGLGDAVEAGGVTALWLTAGLFHPMIETHADRLRGLRQLLAGGDVLAPAHCRRALAKIPGLTLINGYGPTENTTFTTCHRMTRPADATAPVPIGRPVAHTTVHVVDRRMRPVPAGAFGELLTGGAGLARGYAGRPALTAASFVPDPFSPLGGRRLYRTGDLTRWRAGGRLEFLGRLDQQVKIRGFRIEPGEVEQALEDHPAVAQAVVVAHRDPATGDKRLVAYVAPSEEAEPGAAALRGFLAGRLPDHMVPAAFTILGELPLTASGKVDRRRLPEPEWRPDDRPYVAPRTPREELLAGIFADVLGLARVGVHDNFFELGGHSLTAARAATRLRADLGLELPLRSFFEAPTVAALGALISRAQGAPPPPIEPLPRGGRLPLSSAQERLWFLDQLEPGDPGFNIPLPARLRGHLDARSLERALNAVVERHEILRTRFAVAAGRPYQVAAERLRLPLPRVDLRRLPSEERWREAERRAREIGRTSFDLARGPLLAARLLVLAAEDHLLVLVLHHTAGDARSLEILLDELAAFYEAFARGTRPSLAPLPVQYADYAAWQRRQLANGGEAGALDYWRRQLAPPLPPRLALPCDLPRPVRRPWRRGALRAARLPATLAAEVRRLGREQDATLFMTLLAALDVLLHRYTGAVDLVVGSPIAQRGQPEIEGLIGFFVNTLALRLNLGGDPTFREILARARKTALDAYAHADVPFETLVGELHPDRSSSATPLYQVMLALLHEPEGVRPFAGRLTLEALEIHNGTAQLDWTVYAVDTGAEIVTLFEHDRDLYSPAVAERVLADLRRLLESVVADPDQPLSRLLPDVALARRRPDEAPPGVDSGDVQNRLAPRRAQLTEEQKALLARRFRAARSTPEAPPGHTSLVAIHPAGSRPPLFFVHPAGGDVLCFEPLARHLGHDQPFYGLQSRGLAGDEEIETTLEAMARHYVAEMRGVDGDGPYFLGGWSLGGLVAFEMARQLLAAGGEVALLALLDASPRLSFERYTEEVYADDAFWLADIASYAEGLWGKRLGLTYDELRALDPDARLARFAERLRDAGLMPRGGGPPLLRRLLDVFKANTRAASCYEPRPYPGPMTLIRAAETEIVDGDETLGWRAFAAQPVRVLTAPGDHVTLLAEPHVRELATLLADCIESTPEPAVKGAS